MQYNEMRTELKIGVAKVQVKFNLRLQRACVCYSGNPTRCVRLK